MKREDLPSTGSLFIVFQNEFVFVEANPKYLRKMRSIQNTLWDTLEELELAHILQTRVDCIEPNKWMINIFHPDRENARIVVELFVLRDGDIVTSLMERRGFSRRITETILDALVENMDTEDDSGDDLSTISSQSLEQ